MIKKILIFIFIMLIAYIAGRFTSLETAKETAKNIQITTANNVKITKEDISKLKESAEKGDSESQQLIEKWNQEYEKEYKKKIKEKMIKNSGYIIIFAIILFITTIKTPTEDKKKENKQE